MQMYLTSNKVMPNRARIALSRLKIYLVRRDLSACLHKGP